MLLGTDGEPIGKLRRVALWRMKPDLYTKIALTDIAFALVLIAANQYVHPAATANAQGPLAGVQYTPNGNYSEFFDSRTGEMETGLDCLDRYPPVADNQNEWN
jgi:hypothetical protein